MEYIGQFVDWFLHLDKYLNAVIVQYGGWTYLLLFVIVFCETGLVVTPFLPGDSLLFAAGAFAASGSLSLPVLLVLLTVAAILGDAVNYWIGSALGQRMLAFKRFRLVKPEHLAYTHEFYENYGGKTIVIARFVPIVRTLAPFVAGLGRMTYSSFASYNVVGAIAWVGSCTTAGYLFGGLPIVKENFSLVVLAIVFLSLTPALFEYWQVRKRRRAAAATLESLDLTKEAPVENVGTPPAN